MLRMARAAEPIFPGLWGRTKMMVMCSVWRALASLMPHVFPYLVQYLGNRRGTVGFLALQEHLQQYIQERLKALELQYTLGDLLINLGKQLQGTATKRRS